MRAMPRKTALIAACAGALLAGSPSAGQDATSALRGHNSNAPVNVDADRLEVQDRADRAVFSGNVQVRQGELTLNSQRLTVAYSDAGGIEIERLDASGGVTVRSPSETARGQFAVYDLGERLITLVGDVTLTRGGSNLNGGRLVIDLDTGRAVMDGGTRAAPGTAASGGRVSGTFTVPRRDN